MDAHELLARSFGYSDYHDVEKPAELCSQDAPCPSDADVRASIASSISVALTLDHNNAASVANVNTLVSGLSLHAQHAFKSSQHSQPKTDIDQHKQLADTALSPLGAVHYERSFSESVLSRKILALNKHLSS